MQEETSWTIEAWRGLAAWLVIYAHFWAGADNPWPLLQFAFTGVDLFFVLSGFVFAPYFFGKRILLPGFAIRRFFRIYPTYFIALLLYLGLAWLDGKAILYVWEHLTFWYLQSREVAFYYNPAFWSLPSEVEFYIVLPLLATLCCLNKRSFVIVVLVAVLLRLFLGWNADSAAENTAFIVVHHLPGILLEFVLGACAWLVAKQHYSNLLRLALFAVGLGFWCVLAYWFASVGDAGINASWARGQMGGLAALAFAGMVAATAHLAAKQGSLLSTAASWAGRLSFGCYLFHNASLHIFKNYLPAVDPQWQRYLAALATLLVAWLVYVVWEDPWRRWGRRFSEKL